MATTKNTRPKNNRTAQTATAKKRAASRSSGAKSGRAARTTTDHDEIRAWAEQRNGQPACVRGTGGRGDIGMLRLDFPGGKDQKLQKISWEDWFAKFDEQGLAFLHQDKTANGRTSRFNKLVNREEAAADRPKTRRAGR